MRCLFRVRRQASIAPVPLSAKIHVSSSPLTRSLAGANGSPKAIQILPDTATATASSRAKKIKPHELASALYHWTTCVFIIGLVCSQLLGAVWDTRTSTVHLLYGRSPLLGPSQIVGTNDVPYPDRVIACVLDGKYYTPKLVSSLLAAPGVSAILEDSTGTAVHGYRLRQRRVGSVSDALDSAAQDVYEESCNLIAKTMDNIFDACLALGYTNLTRDNLRVVDDWDSKNLYLLPNTLPVLILPYWDNAPHARHAIPTWGGDACVFRLEDAYSASDSDSVMASFRGVNQSVRHERTIEWLERPGGNWKNGWYEDQEGGRWYSDVKSSAKGSPYYMMHRLFDMRTGMETECSDSSDCEAAAHLGRWGNKFVSSDKGHDINSVYIANGTEFGFSLYESYELHAVRTVFDWETLVSNLSVGLVLSRWVLALVSLHSGAFRGKSLWYSGGIGCVAGSGSFAYLPLASLPHLKMTLAAFWTVGCRFEGQQLALAEAWFAIYPAIANVALIYFSLLDFLGKVFRRRVSDVLFAPTVVALCLLHFFRLELAESGWLKGIDGRIPTLVFSDEADKLQLADYFTSDIAWRMNGRVPLVFGLKLAILFVNLVPLFMARSFPIAPRGTDLGLHGVEKALALHARYVGGLGSSLTYAIAVVNRNERRRLSVAFTARVVSSVSDDQETDGVENVTPVTPLVADDELTGQEGISHRRSAPSEIVLVNSYELIRLGYLVYGDKYLITFDEWDLLSSIAPFRSFCHFWNHRVLVWSLRPEATEGDAEIAGGRALLSTEPQMWRLDDPRLEKIRWWQVSACSVQC